MNEMKKTNCKKFGWLTSILGGFIVAVLVFFAVARPSFIKDISGAAFGGAGAFGFLLLVSAYYFFKYNTIRGLDALRGGYAFLIVALLVFGWNILFSKSHKEPLWSPLVVGFLLIIQYVLYRNAHKVFMKNDKMEETLN